MLGINTGSAARLGSSFGGQFGQINGLGQGPKTASNPATAITPTNTSFMQNYNSDGGQFYNPASNQILPPMGSSNSSSGSSIFDKIKQALSTVLSFASMIPGIGQFASMASSLLNMIPSGS